MKQRLGPPVTGHFVTDVIIYLILQIKGVKDKKLGEGFSILLESESEDTVRRHECGFWLNSLPKDIYGISRGTKYRRLIDLKDAGIIERDKVKKCWIPTKEFYSEVVKQILG